MSLVVDLSCGRGVTPTSQELAWCYQDSPEVDFGKMGRSGSSDGCLTPQCLLKMTVAPGIATSNEKLLGTKGIATSNKKLLGAPGIATSNKKLPVRF